MKKKYILSKAAFLSAFAILASLYIPKSLARAPVQSYMTNPPSIEATIDTSISEATPPMTYVEMIPEPTIVPYLPPNEIKEITLSFIGDCVIGTDTNFSYTNSFTQVFDNNNGDYGYFFRGVKDVLENDDLTIANLEGTLTTATIKRDRKFNFKGDPSYVNILLEGSVEVVNLANNHTFDYLQVGYDDTINTLDSANIRHFGYSSYLIEEVKGITIGFAGFTGFDSIKNTTIQIEEAMKYFDEKGVDIKIGSFHWGIEYEYMFNAHQQTLGRFAIDKGADLIIGHHPHILQGIEEYKGKYIVYSLGNFVFGGNTNPRDKDSMIFQKIFVYKNGELIESNINIIPVSISSKTYINDYQPNIYHNEEDKVRVLDKINKHSKNFEYQR